MESKLKIKLKSSSKIVTFEHVILLNRSIGKGEGRREKGDLNGMRSSGIRKKRSIAFF